MITDQNKITKHPYTAPLTVIGRYNFKQTLFKTSPS